MFFTDILAFVNQILLPHQRRILIPPRIYAATTSLSDRGVWYLHLLVKNNSIPRASVPHSHFAALPWSPSLVPACIWTSHFRIPSLPAFACFPALQKRSRHSHYTLYIHRQIAEGSQSRRLPSQQILGPQFSPWWSFLRLLLRCSCGTYQSPRGLVFGRCFALYRTTTWAAALSGETDCLKHWQFRTFIFNYYNIFLSLFPSHLFVFFSFRFSLSGGLGEAHQGGRPSVLLPPPRCGLAFFRQTIKSFLLIVPVVLWIGVRSVTEDYTG